MTYVLFVDTETGGLTQPSLPADHPSQPQLVQLGVILADDQAHEIASAELIVRPDGWSIPDAAARVHGITTELAKAVGIPLTTVLSVFLNLRANADEIVAYNLDFDDLVMRAAIARTGRSPASPGPSRRTCCMRLATPIVDLPPTAKMQAAGFLKNKPPSLTEAHQFFFSEGFKGAHGALADARACARIFFEMRKREAAKPKIEEWERLASEQ